MSRKPFPRFRPVLAALLFSLIALLPACKGSTTPEPPPPTQYQHAITINALTLHTDSAVTGPVKVTMRSSGQVYNGTIGQKIALATTTKQEESCDILISATDCLPREFTEVGVKDSTLSTNVVKLSDVDWDYAWDKMPDGVNRSWVPRKFEVYFNPDPLTGLRLDQGYIEAIKETLNYVQTNSKSWIQTVVFHEDGAKPADATVPPDGEIWVYRRSDVSGIGNVTYPTWPPQKVLSSKESINQEDAGPDRCPSETFDALFGSGQEFGSGDNIGPFFLLVLNRPRDTNNYIISTQKETQQGIDSQTTFTSTTSLATMSTLSPDPATGQPHSASSAVPATPHPANGDHRIRN